MLRADNELNTPQGERAFSILLFQDLSIVPMITIIAAMSRVPPDPSDPCGWTLALYTVLAVAGLVARRALDHQPAVPADRPARRARAVRRCRPVRGHRRSAAVMHILGLSVALGAFVAGVMLAESPYRHELESDVEPFRSILLGLFFMSVGMMLDLGVDRGATRCWSSASRWRSSLIKGLDHRRTGAGLRQRLAAERQARPAAQPGRRIRLRPVRPRGQCAADPARSGVAVRRSRHAVDGGDAVPDAPHRLAGAARGDASATASTVPKSRRKPA